MSGDGPAGQDPLTTARHAICARRMGLSDREFHEWLGQRLDRGLSTAEKAPWENPDDPRHSSYIGAVAYPELPPLAKQAVLSRYRALYPALHPAFHRAALNERQTAGQNIAHRADIAFVTAIAGRYDTPKWHEHLLPGADYILYSDVIRSHPLHRVRPFPYFDADPTRMARFIKTHPHRLLHGYKVVVWVDGNVLMRGDLTPEIDAFLQSGQPIGAMHHPQRSSVYDEAEACAEREKDEPDTIRQQAARYRAEGFESRFLIESNVLMFRMDHPLLPAVMDLWWAEIERGSRRDQLSLPYAIERAGAGWFPIMPQGCTVRNHAALVLMRHEPFRDPVGDLPGTPVPGSFAAERQRRIAAQRGRRMDVVVRIDGGAEGVDRGLTSLAAHRDAACHRLIVMTDADGSDMSDRLRSFAARLDNCQLIEAASIDAVLAASDAEALILLQGAAQVAPDWIEKIFDTFDAHPGIGVVAPLSGTTGHQAILEPAGAEGSAALPEGYDVERLDRWCEEAARGDCCALVPLVDPSCIAIRRNLRQAIGGFDGGLATSDIPAAVDFCLRAADAGFLLAVALHTFVWRDGQAQEVEPAAEPGGTTRLANAARSLRHNPHLVRLRQLARDLPRRADPAEADRTA